MRNPEGICPRTKIPCESGCGLGAVCKLWSKPDESERKALEYPEELTPVLRDVLGLMVFQSCPIAHSLRAGGEKIPRKTEDEQAHVLHWMILLALEHGDKWREKVGERLQQIADAAAKGPGASLG